MLETYARVAVLPVPQVRDIGLLESALQRANLTIYGNEVYRGPLVKVAAVIDSISRNHPLLDGNKRLAVLTADMLLLANGYRYVGGDREDDLFVALAEHRLELPEIAERLSGLWVIRGA
ncbi:Fic family protein [Cnuibacter physcomitrellae]|uniref:type II toxin-antitoxin system death-on-curing family toxin n=1 Tax=Cnuibacter physcomitrellae TaxID=1619308 RepID=UPI00217584AA|nr:Fic family protein [Cnuibacter physcomitrellae]MCS5497945.1 Fic family protein [Cnuibacter physcomitrellae]